MFAQGILKLKMQLSPISMYTGKDAQVNDVYRKIEMCGRRRGEEE